MKKKLSSKRKAELEADLEAAVSLMNVTSKVLIQASHSAAVASRELHEGIKDDGVHTAQVLGGAVKALVLAADGASSLE